MEELKKIDKLLEPDERQASFALLNPATGQVTKLTREHIYESAASIRLHDGVPENVRSHFSTALNLLAYSWFFYPFNVTAQFLGFVSMEYALRERFKTGTKGSFRNLVKRAVKEGLLREEGFSHVKSARQAIDRLAQGSVSTPSEVQNYLETLVEVLPELRNQLAHGAPIVHPNGAASVRISAEFINQLFEDPLLTRGETASAPRSRKEQLS